MFMPLIMMDGNRRTGVSRYQYLVNIDHSTEAYLAAVTRKRQNRSWRCWTRPRLNLRLS